MKRFLKTIYNTVGFDRVNPLCRGILFACLFGPAVGLAEWPSFRGPNGSGIGSGEPPVSWHVETGEHVLWRTPIPGLAHASPITHGDRVFLTTAVSRSGKASLKVGMYGSGNSPAESGAWAWQVLCLDRETGKVRWRNTAHEGRPKQKRHTKATHANSTPATDGKVVVAMFGSEGLYCYDVEGGLRWQYDPGRLEAGPFNDPSLQWGFASSPIIHEGRVIMQCDVLNEGFILVLDLKTGKERLRIPRKEVATWSTPSVVVHEGRAQIVCNGFKHIGGFDLETGKATWWLRGGGDIPVPRPVVANGLIYISNAHGRMSPIYAIRPGAKGDITPDRGGSDGVALWHPRLGSYIPTPIVVNGLVYICNDRGILTCLDAQTGVQQYRRRLADKGSETYSASPVAAGGKVYFTSEEGVIHVLKAGGNFERLASNAMGALCLATPAIDRGRLFVRTRTDLFCIGR